MTILINTRNLLAHTTGVQRYTRRIMDSWKKDGVEFDTISPTKQFSGIAGHAWEQCVLPLSILNHRSNLLWSPSNTGPLCIHKQVVTIHDTVPFDYPETMNSKFVQWYKFLLPKLAKKSRHIITISNFSKSKIIEHLGVPDDKVTVIYNGVDLPAVRENEDESFLKPFGRYILSVGSIEPRKNLKNLIAAWEKINSDLDEDVGLVIVGSTGLTRVFSQVDLDESKLKKMRIIFTGYVSDEILTNLYKNADGFAFVSIYEGFGLPPLEAMLYKIPVLTSNTSSLSELCKDYATLVNPFSVDDIADGLKILCSGNGKNINSAYDYASTLTWSQCAKKTLFCLKNHS